MEKTNVMRILDQKKIKYNMYEYEHNGNEAVSGLDVAMLLNQDPERLFKTLITKGSKNYYVFVVPVKEELDLKKAAKAVGEKSVEMIKVTDINQVTGYIRGGCSPIGMKKSYRTVMNNTALNYDKVIFSAGKIGYQVEMNPNDLTKIVNITFLEII